MFKRALTIVFLCFLFCGCTKKEKTPDTLSVINQRGEMIVGVKTDTPPFGFLDQNGKNIGFDIDLAKLIAKRLFGDENKIKFVPVTPSNRIMKLTSNEVDMVIATMSITPQRQIILDFSVPYHVAGQALMVNRISKISSLMELKDKKVIIVFGSTVEGNLRSNVPNITIIGYKTYPEAFEALKAGKADAMIADDTILFGFAANNSSVRILPKRYSREPYAIAFRKGEESEKLIETVNMELTEAINRGEIQRLKEKWKINQPLSIIK